MPHRQDDITSGNRTARLHLCDACSLPFVVPVCVLDIIDGGRCVMELQCNNCGTLSLGVHGDAALEALDVELERSHAAILAALEIFDLAHELVRVDRFAAALHAGHVLPEDF